MKKILILFWVFTTFCIAVGFAQDRTITGNVFEQGTDFGMPGVTVVVPGTTTGTVTDMNGAFTLTIGAGVNSIQVSFIGMQTQVITLDQSKHYTIYLENEMIGLDEVIAVAYGTTKKSSFTGAASTVKGESLTKMQSANLAKSLEGSLAGVQITQSSGQPGAGGQIIVRGLGSISASKEPLIILDGVPFEGSLNQIPAQDIDNLSVLKDAAANSMYGARGANGVILITTKKGKAGDFRINFDSRYGVNSRGVPNYDIVTNPAEYYELSWEGLRNSYLGHLGYAQAGIAASNDLITNSLKYNVYRGVADNELIDPFTGRINPAATDKKWGNEWETEPFNSGIREEYNLSFSGGTERSTYYASFGYLSDKGIVDGSEFDRLNARLQVDQRFNKWLKLSGNVAYTGTIQNSVSASGASQSNLFMFTQSVAPIYPVYRYDLSTGEKLLDHNGNPVYDYGEQTGRPFGTMANPVATTKANINDNKADNFNLRGSVDFNIIEGLTLTVNGAYDLYFNTMSTFLTPIGGDAAAAGGLGYKTSQRYTATNFNQLLNYSKSFGAHTIKALLGHETKTNKNNNLSGNMANFFDPSNPEFANASSYRSLTSGYSEYALEGYLSRVEYDLSDKYYLSASFRRDGSSVFHPDSRWGNFWSAGASWRISEEDFMKGISFVNNLKLRASYGTQGNDNIGTWYGYDDQYVVRDVGGQAAVVFSARGNPDLTWEKSNNFNVGIESYLFDRVNLSFDFFMKDTKDLLFQYQLPLSEGLPSYQWRNHLDMRNTGVELDMNVYVLKKQDMSLSVNMNALHYKNELLKLPSSKDQDGYAEGVFWRELGGSIYDFYDFQYAGVDAETGRALYYRYEYDHYGNATITTVDNIEEATMQKTGKSSIPDLTGGLGSTFTYKNFDASFQTAFQIGGTVMDSNYQSLMGSRPGTNYHRDILKRWTPNNTDTDVPILENDYQSNMTTDRFYTSASYFSLRNITFGYTLPVNILERANFKSCRVYLTGDNLWLKSARKGLDPRQSLNGAVGFNYSALRTVSFGISLQL
ncbi:SusC/RagA family TonB-linked outer membrane protein [Carboxylicivirga mesophila]|uniref:SusC/RagA family TonB-linked outer membrane protein n=1 Tax=Carboxylicivirga mesophila TaxID=1166478 RepID=A0ABS5KAQ6_9BACT|nr:SusC/RagA family TonB-linked outer membrane protein [Carboxylicivirga mesophila]MBS2212100.1 SusC/RagA family TonB-linked outer membrane protein [Carboxylicivirga mesophila]